MEVVGLWFLNLLVRFSYFDYSIACLQSLFEVHGSDANSCNRKVLEYFLTLSKVMAQDNLGCEEKHFFAAKEEAVARQREKGKYNF